MRKPLDITGKVFGRLTVISLYDFKTTKKRYWNCSCICGGVALVETGNLKSGGTKSCGCFRRERMSSHGMAGTKLYIVWQSMRARCENPKKENYVYYGGRGINVCASWDDFVVFQKWAMSNGYSDGLQIDRTDSNKGYSPENCRFVSPSANSRNRRNNVTYTVMGQTGCVTELAEKYGQPHSRVRSRLKIGWTIVDALFTSKYNLRGAE